jgi:hypothetical protein
VQRNFWEIKRLVLPRLRVRLKRSVQPNDKSVIVDRQLVYVSIQTLVGFLSDSATSELAANTDQLIVSSLGPPPYP